MNNNVFLSRSFFVSTALALLVSFNASFPANAGGKDILPGEEDEIEYTTSVQYSKKEINKGIPAATGEKPVAAGITPQTGNILSEEVKSEQFEEHRYRSYACLGSDKNYHEVKYYPDLGRFDTGDLPTEDLSPKKSTQEKLTPVKEETIPQGYTRNVGYLGPVKNSAQQKVTLAKKEIVTSVKEETIDDWVAKVRANGYSSDSDSD